MDAQDIKCYKHNIKNKKSKTNNGDAEVFVLPPDLLEKLGINLGTVNSDQQLSSETSTKRDCFHQEQVSNGQYMVSSNIDQTISETASLLKESMLITGSPTLIASESRIAGEIEISNGPVQGNNANKFTATSVSQPGKGEINGQVTHNNSNLSGKTNFKDKDTNIFDDELSPDAVVEKISRTDYENSVTSVDSQLEEDKDENKNYYETNDEKKRFLKDKIRSMVINKYPSVQEIETKDDVIHKTLDDSAESIKPLKSLNCSNDLLNDSQINSFEISSPGTTANINIVFDEIVETSKLHDLQLLKSQNSSVAITAITMESVVSTLKTGNSAEEVGDTLSLTPPEINGEDPDKCYSQHNAHYSFDTNQKKLDDSTIQECIPNGLHVNVSRNQEIILEKNDNKLGDLNNLKHKEINNEALVVNNKITTDVEQHVITSKSKLCFQGVEKPGGEEDTNENRNLFKIMKTYQKCKRLTKTVINNSTKSTNEAVCVPRDKHTEEINAVISHEQSIRHEFCICKDFGILNFYDDVKEYEHAHFWKRDIPCVSAELIFSIYDDEYCYVSEDFDLSSNVDTENKSDKVCMNFCWNEYRETENDPDYDGVHEQINISNSSEHSQKLKKNIPTKNKRKQSTEILANKSFNRKELDTMVNSFEVRSDNDDNMGILKGKKNECELLSKNCDSFKETQHVKQMLPVSNKASSSDSPVATVTKDVETPTPKRGRGRPRKHVQPTPDTREPNEAKAPADLTRVESFPLVNGDRKINSMTTTDNNEHSNSVSNLRIRKDLLVDSKTHTENDIENSTELKRKRSSHASALPNIEDSKTENPKEYVPGNSNKEISNDSPSVNVTSDVETPPKKRGRGRPRKHFPPPVSNKSHEIENEQIVGATLANNKSPAKDLNTTIEEIQSSRRRRESINVTKEISENQSIENGGSLRTPRTCTKRASRNSSSHSTLAGYEDNDNPDITNIEVNDDSDVQCGVCDEVVKSSAWMRHIAKEHDYIAWKKGSPRLNSEDECEVKNHLQNILKEMQVLICFKCGIRRKYIASYLKHVRMCDSDDTNVSIDNLNDQGTDHDTSLEVSEQNVSLKHSQKEVRCGVCSKDVEGRDWISHIQREHNYVAWADGQTPLDVNDSAEVQKYLMALAKKLGGLTCYKCRLVRKYANIYLQHVKTCEISVEAPVVDTTPFMPCRGGNVRCGVCFEEVLTQDWKPHAMKKHYNIAWIAGETPIDVKNFYIVESYLKEYRNRHNNKLVCRICGVSKISCCGFYAHIIQCGKTEEESDKYKEFCDICNKKYLCIYKSQHMTMHREKEYAMERKLKLAELKDQPEQFEEEPTVENSGRRRAAEKAKIVIAKYKDELKDNGQKGDTDFTNGYSSDSDVSVKLEQYTDDETDDTDVNSNISEEEHQDMEKKKKRVVESNAPTITRIPFPVKNVRSYVQDSFDDLCKNHLSKKKLFPEWSNCEYEKLTEDQLKQYMPIMEESCKVKIALEGWSTYKRFEAIKKEDCVTMFVGASIQCLSWVPVHLDDINGGTGNFLAVACHSGVDSPRYNCDEAPEHANLLQIWDFGDLQFSTPKLALGIAHDYGTIWAMDWCPSGARDLVKEDCEGNPQKRLGLLAIACSNGITYIFCVPYPSSIVKDDKLFYKIKPVAELRLSTIVGNEKKYQATSLRWSLQKGHNIIVVGYSEGTLAYFDLSNDSPLLVRQENGITVINPFYDERSHNSCVTGVDLYAGGETCWRGGVVSSASSSGARMLTGAPARSSALLSALACAGAYFLPHWPSAVLTAVNSKVNQTVNEVEWQSAGGGWRSGRRVGGVRVRAGCARCGALAAAADPLLCVLHAHPAHSDITKHVAAIIEMSALAQKRKQTNDELAMKLEPLTYDDAVQKYGIEFELVSRKNKAYQQKALSTPMLHYPERFPLAEITSMSFCTAVEHHNNLAVGTHSGILFLVNV